MTADLAKYLVFARYPEPLARNFITDEWTVNKLDRPGWGDVLIADEFSGHEEARDNGIEHAYHKIGFYADCTLRVLTVC